MGNIIGLIQMLGALAAALGELRKLTWLQQVILAGATVSAAAGGYQYKHNWVDASIVGIGALLVQLQHIYSDPPGRVSLPADQPAIEQARKDAAANTARWDSLRGE
ncbi:MAG TPA: hypothetical protein VEC38_10210 [Candidatus Binataceae bacterium]|nr:hypothetical protein [Candidatus Binataceae bacterium]